MKGLTYITLLTVTLCIGCHTPATPQQLEHQLQTAIIHGDLQQAQNILDQSQAPADLATKQLEMALIHTGNHRYLEMVKLLVENGADLNRSTYHPMPFVNLGLTLNKMTPEFLAWCIDHGYDVNQLDANQRSALTLCFDRAVFEPDQYYQMSKLLIDRGAVIRPQLLTRLITTGGDSQQLNKRLELLQLLLDAGVDMEIQNGQADTPLLLAIKFGQQNYAAILIESGANPNAADQYDNAALFHAANSGFTDVVRLLIEAGADVNAVNSRNDTPLGWALDRSDNIDIVEMLLAAGADVNHVRNGKTFLDGIDRESACQPSEKAQLQKLQLIQLLTQYGAKHASELKEPAA